MTEEPRCSVVIPTYGHEAYIADCLRSVQAQTVEDIEILVIDDCSPDGTAAVVSEIAAGDPRVRYIAQERNLGVAAARNRGVSEARSNWVAFLDSDDVWLPGKLERQFEMAAETGAELLYTAACCMDDKGMLLQRRFDVPANVTYESLLCGNDIICSSVLVKREWLLRYPMERDDLHEDYICWLSLLKDGCAAAGVQDWLVLYRLTQGSKTQDKMKAARMTWRSLRYAGVPFLKRCRCFSSYIAHGVRRYLL